MDRRTEAAVAAVARQQMGLITRAQLLDAGVSRSTIRRRVQAGALVQVGVRTHRLASAPADPLADVLAACLDRGAVASHGTAGWLHRVMPRPPWIDVTVAKGAPMRRARHDHADLRVHSSTSLPADDVIVVQGVPTTSLARTLLGLAALVPREISHDELVDVLAASIETGAASVGWVRWLLDERRCRGRDGVSALEAALQARERMGPTESWLERHLLALLEAAGLPRPVLQRTIPRRLGAPARVDFLYPRERIVVEALGYAFHRTPEQISADTMRANELQAGGHLVLQLTARTLRRDPDAAMAVVAAALRERSSHRSVALLTP